MSYAMGWGFGAGDCPGQEVFDPGVGACMCPKGTRTTGIVGECVPEGAAFTPLDCPPGTRQHASACFCFDDKAYPAGIVCNCTPETMWDADKRMCSTALFRQTQAKATGGKAATPTAAGGFGVAAVALVAVGGGLLYWFTR